MEENTQLSAWGLADDVLPDTDGSQKSVKFLFGVAGDEPLAIADYHIREVVDQPSITPWLKDEGIVGVFALRGDIYSMTDPLESGVARRIAVVLEIEGRFLAVGLDNMAGVKMVKESEWEDFESKKLSWARRVWDDDGVSNIELEPTLYLESFTQQQVNSGKETGQ